MLHTLIILVALGTNEPPAPWETVVRIHTEEGIRSGVVIQSDDNSSVAITAGHNLKNQPKNVEVHWFDGVIRGVKPAQVRYVGKCTGEIILIEEKDDYAYIRFYPPNPMPFSPIAKNWTPQIDEKMITVGSSEGEDPTAWSTYIEHVTASHVECRFLPKKGRSGGGLFNSKWELVGICIGQLPDTERGAYLRIQWPSD